MDHRVATLGGLFTTPEAGHVLAGQGACLMIIRWVVNKPLEVRSVLWHREESPPG